MALIWMVISIKTSFLHGFSNVHFSPLPLMMVLKLAQLLASVLGSSLCGKTVENKSLVERKVFIKEGEDVCQLVGGNI